MEFLSFIFLITSLWMLQTRNITKSVYLLILQSLSLSILMIGIPMISLGYDFNLFHSAIAAMLTFFVKVVFLPFIILRVNKKLRSNDLVPMNMSQGLSLLIGIFLIGFSHILNSSGFFSTSHLSSGYSFFAISSILIGCFYMLSHRALLCQIIGIIVMENGIFLYSVSLTNGMPLIFEFGTFFDLLIGVLVMGIMTNYIHGLFESTDTENLTELKG